MRRERASNARAGHCLPRHQERGKDRRGKRPDERRVRDARARRGVRCDPARTRKLLDLGSQEDRAFTGGRAQDRDHPRRYVLRGLRARLSHGAVWPHLPALRQRKNVAQAGQRDQLKGDRGDMTEPYKIIEVKESVFADNDREVEAMNTEKPAETNTGGFRVVMTVLIILMLLVSVGIVVILKLKREGKLPQFLSFLYN